MWMNISLYSVVGWYFASNCKTCVLYVVLLGKRSGRRALDRSAHAPLSQSQFSISADQHGGSGPSAGLIVGRFDSCIVHETINQYVLIVGFFANVAKSKTKKVKATLGIYTVYIPRWPVTKAFQVLHGSEASRLNLTSPLFTARSVEKQSFTAMAPRVLSHA
jgi:hypothetical protein